MPAHHSRYSRAHRRRADAARAGLQPGDRCWLCGQLMFPWQKLELDHLGPLFLGYPMDGPAVLAHKSCNARRGTVMRNRYRSLLRRMQRERAERLGW